MTEESSYYNLFLKGGDFLNAPEDYLVVESSCIASKRQTVFMKNLYK